MPPASLEGLPDGLIAQILLRLDDPGPLAAASRRTAAAAAAAAPSWFDASANARRLAPGRPAAYRALTWRYLRLSRPCQGVADFVESLTQLRQQQQQQEQRQQQQQQQQEQRQRVGAALPDCGGGGRGDDSASEAGDEFALDAAFEGAPGGICQRCPAAGGPAPAPSSGEAAAAAAAAAAHRLLRSCPAAELLLLPYLVAGGHDAIAAALLEALPPLPPHLFGEGRRVAAATPVAWAAAAALRRCGGADAAPTEPPPAELLAALMRRLQPRRAATRPTAGALLAFAASLGEGPLRAALQALPELSNWGELVAATSGLQRWRPSGGHGSGPDGALAGTLRVLRAAAPHPGAFAAWLCDTIACAEGEGVLADAGVRGILLESLVELLQQAQQETLQKPQQQEAQAAQEEAMHQQPQQQLQQPRQEPPGTGQRGHHRLAPLPPHRTPAGVLALVAGKAFFRGRVALLEPFLEAVVAAAAAPPGLDAAPLLAAAARAVLRSSVPGSQGNLHQWSVHPAAAPAALDACLSAARRAGCQGAFLDEVLRWSCAAESFQGSLWLAERLVERDGERRQQQQQQEQEPEQQAQHKQGQQQQEQQPAACTERHHGAKAQRLKLSHAAFGDLCNTLLGDYGTAAASELSATLARPLPLRLPRGSGDELAAARDCLRLRCAAEAGDAGALARGAGGAPLAQTPRRAAFAAAVAGDLGRPECISAIAEAFESEAAAALGRGDAEAAAASGAERAAVLAAALAAALRGARAGVLSRLAARPEDLAAALGAHAEIVEQGWGLYAHTRLRADAGAAAGGSCQARGFLACCFEDSRVAALCDSSLQGGPHLGGAPPPEDALRCARILLRGAPAAGAALFSFMLIGWGDGPAGTPAARAWERSLGPMLRWLAARARRGEGLPPGAALAGPFAAPMLLAAGGDGRPDHLLAAAEWLAAAGWGAMPQAGGGNG
ncbi:hypothetical protein Rsub_04875 [Raphidocelis subcapitata]|uniref:Uncharacterized protein n=1 Tax=Raphidocelis subcapitata TaxID=307507 RepID=A0A2V0NUA4_9CHLO|nr:hypothetical protein Rsub_04875 [Raphidocelis subcapitata]|eukprot:GBF91206.1 hypothetical protein Rsub_04875 [Raphidocelis subcapitata]